jgi:hypothetical protein
MAEGKANRPAPETLTTEDVDRLSERFKPSWEVEPQPEPARQPLKQTMVGGTAPAVPLTPVRAPTAPAAASPTPAAPAATTPLVAKPMAAVTPGKSGLEVARAVRHPTLVGIAPQAIRQVSGAPQAAPDDLDWEVPAGERPQPAADLGQTARIVPAPAVAPPPKAEPSRVQPVQAEPPRPPEPASPAPTLTVSVDAGADDDLPIDVEEMPPESKPSGIGQKYVPRDQDAPAIVLNEEVQRTEAQARAAMEAQHRARSAPTIAKMPAARAPAQVSTAEFADEDTISHRRKRGRGVWVVLGLLTLGSGVAVAALLLRKADVPLPPTERAEEKPVVAADSAAPPPPPVVAEPTPEPRPVIEPAEPAPSAVERPKEPAKRVVAAPPVETPKRAATPAPRPATKPKPTPTPKSGTGSTRPSKQSVIVRDNPF